jgi:hypothetical protein
MRWSGPIGNLARTVPDLWRRAEKNKNQFSSGKIGARRVSTRRYASVNPTP